MAKFEGRGKCHRCERGVDYYSDKNGMAYYNCGPCSFRGLVRSKVESDKDFARLDREAEEDGAAPPVPVPLPVKPAAAPAVPKPNNAPPPPPPKRAGFLDNFSL